MAAVGGDAVDGALVTPQLAQRPQRVCVPQLEHPAPAATQQDRGPRDHAQGTHPVAVGVGDLLLDRVKSFIPEAEQNLPPGLPSVPAAGLYGPGPTS